MFSYFMLRTEQQLFCYLYGGALALSLQLLFLPLFREMDLSWYHCPLHYSGPGWPCIRGTSTR